eukprot:TRINITY_DN17666_c0_g1_i1.p1 TRINITY_DN17666_c0_g1~~TRINITY_DN17666_c0_g1_i1.p1  ORF type:complete len:259 (-),score=49.88 TRINITY_DN17666_c0_g1_i1:86-862(-)
MRQRLFVVSRRSLSTRINMWCGPRTCSTSLMYSFHQRGDAAVFDEPLYAHHLRMEPELERPYKEALLKDQNPDGDAVVRDIVMGDHGQPITFLKHMAKQLVGLDRSFLTSPECKHVILIREPQGLINSFDRALGDCTVADTCLPEQAALVAELTAAGRDVSVIVSEDILAQPEPMLRALCATVGVEFTPAMLSWPAGPKPEIDGVWADHWYKSTHRSTGFDIVNRTEPSPVRAGLEPVLEECMSLFAPLRQQALQAQS